jgi:hypothetical protein
LIGIKIVGERNGKGLRRQTKRHSVSGFRKKLNHDIAFDLLTDLRQGRRPKSF